MLTDVTVVYSRAYDVALQADGKILVTGESYLGNTRRSRLHATPLMANSTLSFGTGGIVMTSFAGAGWSLAQSVAIQRDGKVVVGGTGRLNDADVVVAARYTSDGVIDNSFGDAGWVVCAPGESHFPRVVATPDDTIVITAWNGFTQQGVLRRFQDDGQADPAFGSGGRVVIPGALRRSIPPCRVTVGSSWAVSTWGSMGGDFSAARLNSDGSLDTTFGVGGVSTVDVGGTSDTAFGVAIHPDGSVLLAGETDNPRAAVVRLDGAGQPDPLFGSGGVVEPRRSRPTKVTSRMPSCRPMGPFGRSGLALNTIGRTSC